MAHRALEIVVTLVVAAIAGMGAATPAHAASYRYWSYWQVTAGVWEFATAGPAATVPDDGAVEGWRFAVTSAAGSAADSPSAVPDFAAICGATTPVAGSKRVALVVDPGPATISPDGQTPPAQITTCIVTQPDATGYQVLRAAVDVRTENGLICGIAGYPAGECAPVVDDQPTATSSSPVQSSIASTAMDTTPDAPSGTSGAPWITAAVVAAAAGVGVVLWRRRST